MPKLFLKFSLSRHQGFPPPSVVASADLDRNHRPSDDEFFLITQNALTWQGQLSFDHPQSAEGLTVALVYAANLGAEVNVEVRAGAPDGKLLNKTSRTIQNFPEALFLRLKEPES